MQLLSFVMAALAVVIGASASLSHPARHPAGHLFVRSAHERRAPLPLYQGIDPQLEGRGVREPLVYDSNVKRHCQHDINEFAPRHLRDEDGHLLQKRQTTTTSPGTGTAYPAAGSDPPAASTLPQVWVDKYKKVKAAGLIPDIPLSSESSDGSISYPSGTDMSEVCSWTLDKCNDGNIYQAPDNSVAFGIDDGPTPNGTPDYIKVLNSNNISATHFLIGSAIYWNMPTMQELVDASPSQHLAVHTWSHTLQTTKTDLEILGDLAWVMQIIYDVSGKIPMYFRPPEGDVDNRVKAIAKYVLGMQTVLWT
jgi:chitin deacetylase